MTELERINDVANQLWDIIDTARSNFGEDGYEALYEAVDKVQEAWRICKKGQEEKLKNAYHTPVNNSRKPIKSSKGDLDELHIDMTNTGYFEDGWMSIVLDGPNETGGRDGSEFTIEGYDSEGNFLGDVKLDFAELFRKGHKINSSRKPIKSALDYDDVDVAAAVSRGLPMASPATQDAVAEWVLTLDPEEEGFETEEDIENFVYNWTDHFANDNWDDEESIRDLVDAGYLDDYWLEDLDDDEITSGCHGKSKKRKTADERAKDEGADITAAYLRSSKDDEEDKDTVDEKMRSFINQIEKEFHCEVFDNFGKSSVYLKLNSEPDVIKKLDYKKSNGEYEVAGEPVDFITREDIENELDSLMSKKKFGLDKDTYEETVEYILSFFEEKYFPEGAKQAVADWYNDTVQFFPEMFEKGEKRKLASAAYLKKIRSAMLIKSSRRK